MYIKASASIRSNYNEIAKLCKETGEPVYLTKNGEGDLVVMDIVAFEHRVKELRLAEELLSARAARLNGAKGYTVGEARKKLHKTIAEVKKETEANGISG
ncbi:MAG: type II toxin-antitoxin system Phd/YefM family antitoxin [Oscillospiraceae bacterium]|jgi:PHD/YefM family antitoxin component YafN of YafNO toxin-antitoxin module|nr:type II toxin-antitoxin system Phd/YefM family antitoxin [Oscillospiraceae bacterium]